MTQSDVQIQYSPYQNPSAFLFTEIEKTILNFIRNHKGSQMTKTILRKKNKAGSITYYDFKTYHKYIVIQTVWYCHKHTYRPIEQKGEPRNKPVHIC